MYLQLTASLANEVRQTIYWQDKVKRNGEKVFQKVETYGYTINKNVQKQSQKKANSGTISQWKETI